MKNYIHYVHEAREVLENNVVSEDRMVWWAVRPHRDQFRWHKPGEEPEEWTSGMSEGYIILGGQSVTIYNKDDLAAVRGLLDEIEKELDGEES